MPKKAIDGIYFCFNCRTDLRIKNLLHHQEEGHRVEWFKYDPRDNRFKPAAQ